MSNSSTSPWDADLIDVAVTDIEQKALALLNEVRKERGYDPVPCLNRDLSEPQEALCRAIEQHEATKQELSDFRQEVSDEIVDYFGKKMMIDIKLDINQLDGIVRAWLKDTLETVQHNAEAHYVHPEDAKTYRKDIKALKRLLDYIGE